ncbi:AfsA-related hotdog domain-containing protein [Streptomyces camelliae]|uniref:AfsA-related hotdog domain-containing protein n=1 Tax=Streptomyces camelliae TaxID=3004093 RepID=A0ABY7P121_9ACTN|nr:AfsA-related hotdog domain-containing protein [Streptomyces sp. HUAS 2-6]WBO63437.1 AfsA-related hotdog domain-containing protein [Streptomyces sp. HUAS 2-6]
MPEPSGETLIVVGDRFEEFLRTPGTIAASAVRARLEARDTDGLDLVAGQGLSAELLAELGKHWPVPMPAPRELTHKRLMKNVMVGEPSRAGDHYEIPLVLDERCETLEDHLTGRHIPAVALTEAARQSWTAVTERFLPTGLDPARFVIDDFHASFRAFVFPLPATLTYEVLEHEPGTMQHRFHSVVRVRQSDTVAAEVEVRFRVVAGKLADKQEAMAARQAVVTHLRT